MQHSRSVNNRLEEQVQKIIDEGSGPRRSVIIRHASPAKSSRGQLPGWDSSEAWHYGYRLNRASGTSREHQVVSSAARDCPLLLPRLTHRAGVSRARSSNAEQWV